MVQKKKHYKKTLYNSFVNNFILQGKKTRVKDLIDNTLCVISKSLNISIIKLFFKIYFKLDSFVEIKQVKIKRRIYTIPFAINYSRRIYIIIKKIKNAIKLDKRKVSLSEKLNLELRNILTSSNNSKAIKVLKNNQLLIRSSRSNIHFRWK